MRAPATQAEASPVRIPDVRARGIAAGAFLGEAILDSCRVLVLGVDDAFALHEVGLVDVVFAAVGTHNVDQHGEGESDRGESPHRSVGR